MKDSLSTERQPEFSRAVCIDFGSQTPPFTNADKRAQAVSRFYRIVQHFGPIEENNPSKPYNRATLIRLTFEYARSPESQDRFLAFFFQSLTVGMLDDEPVDYADPCLGEAFLGVAEFLITNFFLPLRASAYKTPRPSPAQHSALQKVLSQEEQRRIDDSVGTPERILALRTDCLERDRNRCVATSAFNRDEAQARIDRHGQALDDDGNLLTASQRFAALEVAHIIPYGLTKVEDNGRVGEGKKAAIAILNMFDLGVANLIEGVDINRPYNAITLSHDMHKEFGNLKIYFKHLPEDAPSTYYIGTFRAPFLVEPIPLTRTLFTHPTIDPPSQRLLTLHYAIAHILHISGAGDYIDEILRDMELGFVCEDGSTQLGLMVQLALGVHG